MKLGPFARVLGSRTRRLALAAGLLLTLSACGRGTPKSPESLGIYPYPPGVDPERPSVATPGAPWPEIIVEGDDTIAMDAPHVESWTGERLTARVAVEVDRVADGITYGFVWIEARTTTDTARRRIALADVRLVRASFPSERADESGWLAFLQSRHALEGKELALTQVHTDLALGQGQAPLAVKDDPPRIVFTDRPEVLVLVDGPPVLRGERGGLRVINTRALLVFDDDVYWAWVGDRWFHSRSADGRYVEATSYEIPADVDVARIRLEGASAVDLFTEEASKTAKGASVFVATSPTELIETHGAPTYAPIQGTTLEWLTNTNADLFRDKATNALNVLLAGRWFRAPSVDGPWVYVPPSDLPATFARIPADHVKADIRASVSGTPEAEEALIASTMTTMAAIDRAHVHLAVAFDGPPQLEPIAGTSESLRYATNTPTPVIEAGGQYYALENGVWFGAPSPTGPWEVATNVPDAVYSIPASSPIYYATYVRVYDWTPDWVYVGFDAIRRLRGAHWETPAILMTAFPEAELKRRAAAALHVQILPKPFSLSLLTSAVVLSLLGKSDQTEAHGFRVAS